MGHAIEKFALQRGHEIVSIIDVDNQCDFDSEQFKSADVAIEFTTPSTAYDNCLRAIKQGVKVVSGSTGWTDRIPQLRQAVENNENATFFYSSNYSIGVNIFFAVNKYLARIMNGFGQYDEGNTSYPQARPSQWHSHNAGQRYYMQYRPQDGLDRERHSCRWRGTHRARAYRRSAGNTYNTIQIGC